MQQKKTIAVDIDDVLAAHVAGFIAFSNLHFATALTAADYTEDWCALWQVSVAEADRRTQYMHEHELMASYACLPEAYAVLARLRQRYRLVVATSRKREARAATDAWLARYFPDVFEAIHYAGMWDKQSDHQTKLCATKRELCLAIGADYLIDDQPKHVSAVAEAGMAGLLFGDYVWNAAAELPARIVRVSSWLDVERFFDAESR